MSISNRSVDTTADREGLAGQLDSYQASLEALGEDEGDMAEWLESGIEVIAAELDRRDAGRELEAG